MNKASSHQKNLDVGANLFVGNLDPEIDEKLLYDTFTAFGVILQTPKIMRDPVKPLIVCEVICSTYTRFISGQLDKFDGIGQIMAL